MLDQAHKCLTAVNDKLESIMLWSSIVMFVVMIGCNAMEIITRTLFSYSFIWVQELSILLLGTIVFFGGSVVLRRKRDASVTFFVEKFLPQNIIKGLLFVFNLVIIFYLILIAIYGIKLQSIQVLAQAIYLPITVNWFSFPIIVFSFVTILAFIEHSLEIVADFVKRGKNP